MTSYGQVTESNGENYENGGTETNYFIQQDVEAGTIMGSDIVLNGAKTNYSISYNGKLKSENIIKRLPDDSKIVVKSTSYHYKEDPRAYRELSGYLASQNGTTVYLPDTTTSTNLAQIQRFVDLYALKQYYIISPWVYPDTVKQITYDENGLNPVSETSVNYYDNINHLQVTRVESVNSKGELIRKQNKYPEDFTALSPYAEMVANNMTGQVVESKDFNNNVETAATRVHYKKWDNNNFDVDSLLKSYRGGPYQQEGIITKRDSAGNVLEYTNKNSIENSVLWGYKRTYPVALIKGTNYAQVISSLSVSESALQNLTNAQLESAVNNLRNTRTQITSYLYKPLTGVIGVTDTKGLTTSYEYDNFQRLKDVKDKDGKVIKHTDYHYQGQ
jgi:YD repeat-containing protein